MADLYRLDNIANLNEDTLKVLVRGIKNSQRSFSLILVRCNYKNLRERMLKRWQEIYRNNLASSIEIRELILPANSNTLYTTIQQNLKGEQPQALMIFGLESVNNVDEILISANNVREEFRKNFPFPLVLWITDNIYIKLLRLAPDFISWEAYNHELKISTEELLNFLRKIANDISSIGVDVDVVQRSEIELALKELQNRNYSLQAELIGSLRSLLKQENYIKDQNKLNLNTESNEFEDKAANNESSLQILLRAIALSQGTFSLVLARCNYIALRDRIVERLHQLSSVKIGEIVLSASVKTLYTNILAELGDEQPPALMIFGLDSVKNLDTVLISTNSVREEFRKNFPFPIVLWLNDTVLKKLIRFAPDFDSWATTIEFALSTNQLINFINQVTDEIFASDTTPNLEIYWQLQTALQDLQQRGIVLEPVIAARFEFFLGLFDYLHDQIDSALGHYEISLAFWQSSNYLEQQGILLLNLGLAYYRKFEQNRNQLENIYLQEARHYFQQCFDMFEQCQRLDLLAKHTSKLGEVLRHLQAWDDLQILAKKTLALHQNYGNQLEIAQDYGFLAEVALKQSSWAQANQLAKQALQVLSKIPDFPPHKFALYLLILARTQDNLNKFEEAINTLEIARQKTKPQSDPELYIQILADLRYSYFKKGEYLAAFQIKQEQRSIEKQYGFRAFVGAGRLQPQQAMNNSTLPFAEHQATVATEIAASGRQQDINRLIERIGRADHKLTVIHGQSGVGKSSILQAGLIPALKQKSIDTRDVLLVLQQVYTDWMQELGRCLQNALMEIKHPSSVNREGDGVKANFDSSSAILKQLHKHYDDNLLTVIIFDQLEEFFFVHKDPSHRRYFYTFLLDCLNIPYVKIILSLREDYLHYLLEFNRIGNFDLINNNILDKNILYYLDNFSPTDAKLIIQRLTQNTAFHLEPALVNQLVQDLTEELGEVVRPIELQVVGAQLQTENITTLTEYQRRGTKKELVKRYLDEVINDCGIENRQVAELILYLLTDENNTRPLKNRAELAAYLEVEAEKLDLVLKILVNSGLVFQMPGFPSNYYQLVHDYLVAFIRQQRHAELLAELKKETEQRILAEAKLNRTSERLQKQLFISAVTLLIAALLGIGMTLPRIILPIIQNSHPKVAPTRYFPNKN